MSKTTRQVVGLELKAVEESYRTHGVHGCPWCGAPKVARKMLRDDGGESVYSKIVCGRCGTEVLVSYQYNGLVDLEVKEDSDEARQDGSECRGGGSKGDGGQDHGLGGRGDGGRGDGAGVLPGPDRLRDGVEPTGVLRENSGGSGPGGTVLPYGPILLSEVRTEMGDLRGTVSLIFGGVLEIRERGYALCVGGRPIGHMHGRPDLSRQEAVEKANQAVMTWFGMDEAAVIVSVREEVSDGSK